MAAKTINRILPYAALLILIMVACGQEQIPSAAPTAVAFSGASIPTGEKQPQIDSGSSNNSSTQPTSTEMPGYPTSLPQSGLDHDSVLFRDKALPIVRGLNTVQYTFTRMEPSASGDTPFKHWSGTSTQTSIHETYYAEDGNVILESIKVDNIQCGKSDETWNCSIVFTTPTPPFSLFSQITNVLNGRPFSDLSEKQVMATGSILKSFDGEQCRAFNVQFKSSINDDIKSVGLDEACFDPATYYPLYMRIEITTLENGEIRSKYGFETTELKFNTPIDPIVLPQH